MPGLFDFYSPFFSAWINTKAGARIPLWANWSAQEASSAALLGLKKANIPLKGFPYLSEISVEFNLGQIPTITATLTPPFQEARAWLDSDLASFGENTLTVQYGYTSGGKTFLSPPFSGLLVKPDIQLGTEAVFTLHARGIGMLSALGQEGSRIFANQTRRSIIRSVLSGGKAFPRNITPNDDLVRNHNKDPSKTEYLTAKVTEHQGGLTDFTFIWKIVRDAFCTMYVLENKLVIKPLDLVMGDAPKRTLQLFDFPGRLGPGAGTSAGGSTGPNAIFPILAVSSPSLQVYLPGATKAVVINSQSSTDPAGKQKKAATVIIDPDRALPSRAGPTQTPGKPAGKPDDTSESREVDTDPNSASFGDGGGRAPYYDSSYEQQQLAATKAEIEQLSHAMGVKLEIQTLGIPDLFPGDTVEVKSVGARYDNIYAVFKVTHTIGAGGYFSTLECISNTDAMLKEAVLASGRFNNQAPSSSGGEPNREPGT